MHIYTHIYTYLHTYIHVHTRAHIHTHIYIHTCTYNEIFLLSYIQYCNTHILTLYLPRIILMLRSLLYYTFNIITLFESPHLTTNLITNLTILNQYQINILPTFKTSFYLTFYSLSDSFLISSLSCHLKSKYLTQYLTHLTTFQQRWFDEILTWNPEDFGGIGDVRLRSGMIWTPDIVLYNK